MKSIKKLFITSCLALILISCNNPEQEYYDVPENYKSACLYYAVEMGDSLIFLRGSVDTIAYTVNNISLHYFDLPYDNRSYQVLDVRFLPTNNHVSVQMSVDTNLPEIYIRIDNFDINGTLESSNYSDTITGIFYSDLYKIRDMNISSRYIITSRSQGIVYAQNDTITYERIY
ncbi:MAG: hypothetical protein JXR53_06730 [Bacteroidales bacterium]|nr:hypothetical protein [Bacteroidales bacterium]